MTSHHGVNGKVLHIHLNTGTTEIEHLSEDIYRQYIGGKSLGVYYLLRHLKPGIDPLSPENIMVFSTGPLTGMSVSGSGRCSVVSKSPLTSGLGTSEAGGFWGSELKRAGFDAIIITGRAPQPVYLLVENDHVELRSAEHLWGKLTGEAAALLNQELGTKNVRTALIGPAGEHLVRYANIAMDLIHFAGRWGLGAVMGSKNLKGIVVKPTGASPAPDNRSELQATTRWLAEHPELWKGLHDTGTASSIEWAAYMGALPTHNFSQPTFPGAEAITGEKMRDTIQVNRDTCFACIVQCKRVVEVTDPQWPVNRTYGGPEYESVGAFGSNCGVADLKAIAKANEICNANGMDAISAGMTISFAMECMEKGLLTTADTDGRALHFGNAQAMLETLQDIVARRGFGNLLAEGSARAAKSIPGSADYAIHVKGAELPMHEPRMRFGQGLGFAISPTGPDHMANMYDTGYTQDGIPDLEQIRTFFPDAHPIPLNDLSHDKVRLLFLRSNWQHFLDCALVCHFLPYDPTQMTKLMNAVTGWDADPAEYLRAGERYITLARLFNLREGLTARDDTLPKRFFQAFNSGPLTGKAPSVETFEQARSMYYEFNGWTATEGVPTLQRLAELGVEWAG